MRAKKSFFWFILGLLMFVAANDLIAIVAYQFYVASISKNDLIRDILFTVGLGILPSIGIMAQSADEIIRELKK